VEVGRGLGAKGSCGGGSVFIAEEQMQGKSVFLGHKRRFEGGIWSWGLEQIEGDRWIGMGGRGRDDMDAARSERMTDWPRARYLFALARGGRVHRLPRQSGRHGRPLARSLASTPPCPRRLCCRPERGRETNKAAPTRTRSIAPDNRQTGWTRCGVWWLERGVARLVTVTGRSFPIRQYRFTIAIIRVCGIWHRPKQNGDERCIHADQLQATILARRRLLHPLLHGLFMRRAWQSVITCSLSLLRRNRNISSEINRCPLVPTGKVGSTLHLFANDQASPHPNPITRLLAAMAAHHLPANVPNPPSAQQPASVESVGRSPPVRCYTTPPISNPLATRSVTWPETCPMLPRDGIHGAPAASSQADRPGRVPPAPTLSLVTALGFFCFASKRNR
jgi:hypothetical protein